MSRVLLALVLLVALGLAALTVLGKGWLVAPERAGRPQASAVPRKVVAEREARVRDAAVSLGVAEPKQILFGDLHVHTTFSADAFQMSLPMAGGDGAHPVADACDFARFCAGLDFWSINDHAITSTPRRWAETVDSMRQCDAVAGDPANPDVVPFLGWEWTQIGTTPANHYGHKNVVLRDLEQGRIPPRPIAAGPPPDTPALDDVVPSAVVMGLLALAERDAGGPAMARYVSETAGIPVCPSGRRVRDLPADCREQAATPAELFAKLDDWGHSALVIPHGTTWGMYTPPGSSWDKHLAPGQHDPGRQRLIEVFSGHGNSEEVRPWREVAFDESGRRSCPEPVEGFLPACWRAGEIIEARCTADGEPGEVCARRAENARRDWVDADRNSGLRTVPGTRPADWLDAGQCTDCFQPSFNYRPRSSVQYLMALRRQPSEGDPGTRFRFGFLASSDNHSARPGTGYKEVARREFTEARFGEFPGTPLGRGTHQEPRSVSQRSDADRSSLPVFAFWEGERAGSFFLNGGLTAVHAGGRSREAIWQALLRREVYGTSGPRILLWFDLLNAGEAPVPMGGEARMAEAPAFEVRAVGSFEQRPGCPSHSMDGLSPTRIERLCQDECYHPSDARRPITRIEIVRIRPQQSDDEDPVALVEDPWKVLPCADAGGCTVRFRDDDFAGAERDTVYYARAIEAPSPAVAADPLRCEHDESGRCVSVRPCFEADDDDDCLSETEERAWSSPIFVDWEG